ncbi:putative ribonuclease H-like domain-containing protein [Tanacetum coccineum]
MVQKPVLNNVKKGIGQREVRQVWNNAMRVNHQNFPKRDFAPIAVLTKSGIAPISAARQNSSRAAAPVSAVRHINTAAPKPFVNVERTRPNTFHKSHSTSRTSFYQQTALKNRNLNDRVNTAKVNSVNTAKVNYVNTAKGNKVTSAIGKQGINAVKSSACWFGRPKRNVIDHISKYSGSYMPKRFDYVDPQGRLESEVLKEVKLLEKAMVYKLLKQMNKLVREYLVRTFCLQALFENDIHVFACQEGRKHDLSFMRPFGCPVTILNTLDHLGTRPNWMFDIDTLTMSMNYQPVLQGIKLLNEGILLIDARKKKNGVEGSAKEDDINDKDANSTYRMLTPVSAAKSSYENLSGSTPINAATPSNVDYPTDPLMPDLEDTYDLQDTGIFGNAYDDEDVGVEVYEKQEDESGIVIRNNGKIGWNKGLLSLALVMGFIVYQMDVKSAFLYGIIEEEVYVCQPSGFEDPQFPNKDYKVDKALYGLHQAPRAWYETLSTYLLENRFRRGIIDKTLSIKKDKSNILLVQVYVDDIIFRSTKKSLCTEFESLMYKRFQMSSMRELTFFLGLQVKQKNDGIFISQDKYVADI